MNSDVELENQFYIPGNYRKHEINYSKSDETDFNRFNKTRFAGLENGSVNSYCNSLLQVLHYLEPVRTAVLNHLCTREFCMACELGFLFHMFSNSHGLPCLPNNLLRAFRTKPEASALGLIMNENEAKKGNLVRMIQGWNRFILQQLHSEMSEESLNDEKQGETVSEIGKIFSTELREVYRCRCSLEKVQDSSSLLFSLNYPDCTRDGPVRYSFSDIVKRSLCLEQKTPAWCDECTKYNTTYKSRQLKELPFVLPLSCGMENASDFTFWKTQMELLKRGNDKTPAKPGVKQCRYGESCTKPDCQFNHVTAGENGEEQESGWSRASWVPLGLKMKLQEGGDMIVENVDDVNESQPGVDADGFVMYHLVASVSLIKTDKSEHTVSCIKVSPPAHIRGSGSPVHQWYVFNDFSVSIVGRNDAVWFDLNWKLPCVLYYARIDLNDHFNLDVRNPVTSDVFLEDKSLAQYTGRRKITFTPLGMDEMPTSDDIVAMDAEFVALNQEEAEIRSDGTRSTIRPSQMSVARITCIRGKGELECVPFIDDYISTQEQVVDYKTKFSGIKPGDLNATISSKHLTTLKSTYTKLRFLIDSGVKLVGHGLKNDFRVINLVVPPEQVFDTVYLFNLHNQRMISLKFLAWYFLGIKIQSVTHDSIEDARTALKLFRKYLDFKRDNTLDDELKKLYEKGRRLQWNIPGQAE